MIILISPSKTQETKFRQHWTSFTYTTPMFLNEAIEVNNAMKEIVKDGNVTTLAQMFGINEYTSAGMRLLRQTEKDIECFETNTEFPAIFYYDGMVFKEIIKEPIVKEEIEFLNNNLFIMSAYYGLVKPLDNIKSYRLMMDSNIKISNSKLSSYWKTHINEYLIKLNTPVVNLSSREYTQVLDYKKLNIIDVDFLAEKNGKLRSVATYKKQARGMMINFLMHKKEVSIEAMKQFNEGGYNFIPEKSTDTSLVFVKKED